MGCDDTESSAPSEELPRGHGFHREYVNPRSKPYCEKPHTLGSNGELRLVCHETAPVLDIQDNQMTRETKAREG